MDKFTPAPWKVEQGRGAHVGWAVITAEHAGMTADSPLAKLSSVVEDEHADAMLIAAAPDLLEALQGIAKTNRFEKSVFADDSEFVNWAQSIARAAIAKALT